ncbi:hypothetical protein R1T16_17570 [Flavobacterium sp. DG1-102-2]|uniref:hypothetical protein n=1 Tax=Flavobacterium sp. DG1-102-2 TaxID=3081663 RepID=UPI00294953BE|nr:hypothetical protein [Flavobacterium sp. DG1-102-2]MDV6170250.1 hypothetical protein [Flavobacterium sp. DG1-102-2]
MDFDFCETCGSENVESRKVITLTVIRWESNCKSCNKTAVIAEKVVSKENAQFAQNVYNSI